MRNRFMLALTAALISVVAMGGVVLATNPTGVNSTTLAIGRFDRNIDASTKTDIDPTARHHFWKTRITTKGSTDVWMVENKIVPGGSFGWHSHPGPSLVIVKSGTLTLYRGDDPTCAPQVVGAGSGFVDDGGDIHLVRNEGTVETDVFVTSLVPAGFARRIDVPAPGNCPF